MSDVMPADDELTPIDDLPPDSELTRIEEAPAQASDQSRGLPVDNLVTARTVEQAPLYAVPDSFSMADEKQVVRQQENAALRFAFEQSQKLPNDAAALEIAKKFNVRAEYVRANLPAWQQAAAKADFDPEAIDPALRKAMLRDPELAPTVLSSKTLNPLFKAFNKVNDWLESDRPFRQTYGKPGEEMPVSALVGPGTELTPEETAASFAGIEPLSKQLTLQTKAYADLAAEVAAVPGNRAKRDAPRLVQEIEDNKAALLREGAGPVNATVVAIARAKEAQAQLDLSKLWFRSMAESLKGNDTTDLDSRIHDAELAARPRAYGEDSTGQFFTDAINGAVSSVDVLGSALKTGGVVAGAGAVVGGAAGAYATKTPMGALEGAVAGASKGAELGGTYGAAERTFVLEAGSSYKLLLELETDGGRKLTRNEAAGGAILAGLAKTGLEMMSLKALVKTAGPAAQLLRGKGLDEVSTLLAKNAGFRKMAAEVATAYADGVGTEFATEVMQEVVDQVAPYVAASAKDAQLQRGPIVKPMEALEAGYQGGVGALFMGAGGASFHIATSTLGTAKSVRDPAKVDAITALADDEATKAAPAVVAEAVKEAGGPESMHVDAKAVVRFFQQKGEDGQAANAEVERLLGPEGPQKLMEAAAVGGKVEVPMATYLGAWAASEVGKATKADTSTDAATLSHTELRAQAAEIEAEAQAIAAQEAKKVEDETAANEMADSLYEELRAAGRSTKEARSAQTVWKHFWRTQGADFGVAPAELFKDVRVHFGLEADRAAIESQSTDAFRQPAVPAEEALRARYDAQKLDTPEGLGQRQRDFFIDSTTGLLNARAWKRIEPTAKSVATISVEGVKYANDKQGGHQAGDAVYAAAAQAMAGLLPGLAKVGGDFAVANITQAELDAALAKANADPVLQGFALSGHVAENTRAASKVHNATKAKLEKDKKRAERGQKPFGAPEGKLKLDAKPLEGRDIAKELQDAHAALDPEAAFRETYFEPGTGLLTKDGRDAYLKLHPQKFHVSIDLNLLKAFNKIFEELAGTEEGGQAGGDQILAGFGQLLAKLGGAEFLATHVSGDEYSLNANNDADLRAFLGELEKDSAGATLPLDDDKGGQWLLSGFSFGFGLAENIDGAEAELTKHKERLAVEGKRGRTLEESIAIASKRLSRRTPGDGGPGGQVQGGGPADVSRGADVQGAPSSAQEGNSGADLQSDSVDVGGVGTFDVAELNAELATDEAFREKSIKEQREKIARIRTPARKAYAEAWLAFTLGEGPRPTVKPGAKVDETMRRKIERDLEAAGFVDPDGPGYGEDGRSLHRTVKGKKNGGGAMPEELARAKLGDAGYFSPGLIAKLADKKNRKKQDERGSIEWVTGAATERALQVFLRPNADVSTVMHESAHAFLEMMGALAARTDAPQRVRDTYAMALEALGAEPGKKLTVDQHEHFAKGFEKWLYEGKAPSKGLEGAFQRFKAWLLNVYRTVASIDVELTDDLREVFARMLATDDEIQRQLRQRAPATEASTPEQQAEDLLEAHELTRKAELYALKDRLRTHEKWWKDGLAKLRTTFGEEYERLPARVAQRILQGEADDVVLASEPLVLDKAFVEAVLGERRAPGIRTAVDGVDPDEVAQLAGFETGADMLRSVVDLPQRDTWVEKQAEEAMKEAHPSVLEERTRLRELVADGLQGFSEKKILREWAALTAKAGGSPAPVEALKRAASIMVERRKVGDLKPARALQAERAAATAKARAAAKGDWTAALEAGRQQLLNAYLYAELRHAKKEREALEGLASELRSTKARARLGKAMPVYRDAVDFVLGLVGLSEPTELKPEVLDQAVAQMNGDAVIVGDPEWLEPLRAVEGELKTLTVTQMRVVGDALKQLRAAARHRTDVLLDDKAADKEETIAALVAEAEAALPKRKPPGTASANTVLEKLGGLYNLADGTLMSPTEMVRDLAGDDPGSTWWRALVLPFRRAKHREADLLKSTIKPITDAFDAIPKAVRARFAEAVDGKALFPNHTDAFQAPRRRFELFMLALNAGNESNLQRLTDGRNITVGEVRAALDLLTKEELDAVQSIFDAAESLRPEAFALEERVGGLAPKAIEATPMTLKGGTLRGGYFPAVYERAASVVGARQEASALAQLLDPSYSRPGTPHSHLKSRADRVEAVISLEPRTIGTHLAQVAHDIAFREAVMSIGSLVISPEIKKVLTERLGEAKEKQFLQWVKDVGSMRGTAPSSGKVLDFFRSKMPTALLGFSAPTALGDLANLAAAVTSTPLTSKHLAAGLAEFAASPVESRRVALEKSGELRSMQDTIKRDFAKATKALVARGPLETGPLAWLKDNAFAFMEGINVATATPVWLGGYRQAIAEGKSEGEAVRFADDLLTRVFPSHSAVDQAAILRDKGWLGKSTVFYGYLSTAFNAFRGIARPLRSKAYAEGTPAFKVKAVAQVAGRGFAFAVAFSVLGELLMGRGPDDGDRDKEEPDDKALMWRNWFVRKMIIAPFSTIPFVSEVAAIGDAKAAGRRPNPRTSPVMGAVLEIGKASEKVLDGDAAAADKVTAGLKAFGLTTGVPTKPLTTTGRYLFDIAAGEREVDGWGQFMGGIIYGERDNQPINVFTAPGPLAN